MFVGKSTCRMVGVGGRRITSKGHSSFVIIIQSCFVIIIESSIFLYYDEH